MAFRTWFASAVAAAVAVSGCGVEPPPEGHGTIEGTVWMGSPLQGATVRVIQWDQDGNAIEQKGEPAITDDTGAFSVTHGNAGGIVLIEVSGPATYEEPFTGSPIVVDNEVVLRGAVWNLGTGESRSGIVISPVTTLAVAQAEAKYAAGGGGFETISDAVAKSYDHLGAHFGGIALDTTLPVNLRLTERRDTNAEVRYALSLMGLSYVASTIAADAGLTENASNLAVLTGLLSDDLSDARALFDGSGPNGAISLGACDSYCALDANTVRSGVGLGIQAFIASTDNRTQLELGDVALLIQSITKNEDPYLFPADQDPDEVDETPPMIVFEPPTPANAAVVAGLIEIRARAADDFTREPPLAITAPGWLADEDGDPENEVILAHFDVANLPAEQRTVVVTLSAKDAAGNVGTATRRFTIDRGPPLVEITRPQSGGVYRGSIPVEAVAIDGNLASFAIEEPAGLVDDDAGLDRILASYSPGARPDGPIVFRVRAVDEAGFESTAEVTVLLDRTPPDVAVTAPAGGTWTATPTVTVRATATDALAGVAGVSVETGGVTYPASLVDGAWEATVPLSADACGTPGWSGANVLRVRAWDAAGNVSPDARVTVHYDNCDPTIVVSNGGAAAAVPDERDLVVRFPGAAGGDFTPRFSGPGSRGARMEYDLSGTAPGPSVYKYTMRHDGVNPVTWHLWAQDNRGVARVEYRLRRPGEGSFGPWTTSGVLTPSDAGVSHRIVLTRDNAPGIDTMDGEWQMALRVTDMTGRTYEPPHPVRWRNRLIGGPVYVQAVSASEPLPSSVYAWPSGYGPRRNNLSVPYGTGKRLVVQRYRIINGTGYDTMVSVQPKVTAVIRRTFHRRNVMSARDPLSARGPNCSSNAFSPASTGGACLAAVPPTTSVAPAPLTWDESRFIRGVDARRVRYAPGYPADGAAVTACSGPGCDPYQWVVPGEAIGGGPGVLDVIVWTNDWTFLWYEQLGGTPADRTVQKQVAPTGTWRVFGTTTSWGSAYSETVCDDMHRPPCTTLDFIARHLWVKYLYSVSVVANDGELAGDDDFDRVEFAVQAGPDSVRFYAPETSIQPAHWVEGVVAPMPVGFVYAPAAENEGIP
ncbi:MAG: hypothetical protein D6689_18135 [Deltaproteobacteria bacterium]|nr:MAG: hypothetical protein D6689_18135 [Deltaproteobacteria bacterium]